VQDAGKAEADRSSSTRPEKTGRAISPTQDGTLPHGAIPRMDKERGHGGVWVVPVQKADAEPPVQRMQAMEIAAEGPVERGTKGNRERKEPLLGPDTAGRRAMHQRSPDLFVHHGAGEQGGPEDRGRTDER